MDFITFLQGLIHNPESNVWLSMILVLLGAALAIVPILFPTAS